MHRFWSLYQPHVKFSILYIFMPWLTKRKVNKKCFPCPGRGPPAHGDPPGAPGLPGWLLRHWQRLSPPTGMGVMWLDLGALTTARAREFGQTAQTASWCRSCDSSSVTYAGARIRWTPGVTRLFTAASGFNRERLGAYIQVNRSAVMTA